MGKPFNLEISKIQDTYNWAWGIEEESLIYFREVFFEKTLIAVGSGGATCCACLLSIMQQNIGKLSNYTTPLELQNTRNCISKDVNVVLLSASGKNSDILFAFDISLNEEPNKIISFCLKLDSKLSQKSSKYSISEILQFNNPQGKDGFLATNSTIAFFTLISRIYNTSNRIKNLIPTEDFIKKISVFASSLNDDFTLIVLYGSWGKPVAVDIESKFSEAGLGNVLLTDYRNFGHGRHNWLDKKKEKTAIVSLISPEDEKLALETLKLIPEHIPVLEITTTETQVSASIDLLSKSFYLVNEFGKINNIDPGRPGVPEYGSKLYNLRYSKFYANNENIKIDLKLALKRKFGTISQVDKVLLPILINSYKDFVLKLRKENFNTIIFDYDGTLCSHHERLTCPRSEIIEKLNFLLSNGITIGIATGRGKSVRDIFKKVINKEFHNNFFIGYYNGDQIGTLSDNDLPIKDCTDSILIKIANEIENNTFINDLINIDLRKGQITITTKDNNNSTLIKGILRDMLYRIYENEILILESSHSIDIIKKNTSKNGIIQHLKKNLNYNITPLCIGDKGVWPGNDYKLLSNEFSLSVDEVSKDPFTCWNLSSPGIKHVESTLEYLNSIIITEKGFKIKI